MKQKVKAAAEDQRRQRQWQAEKIELIVNKLTLDIENVSSAKDPNRSDESLDPAQIQKFNQSLATTKEALVTLQQVVNNYGTTNSELETQNSKQTLKIEEYEKQIFELKQQLTDSKEKVRENVLRAGNLLSTVSFTNELKSETRSINHDAEEPQCDWKSKAHSLEAALSKTERARREEVLNLRHRIGEINSRNQKAIKQLESNIQMLEGEAATRMESLTELRNQNLRLKDELNQKSKKIIAAEEEFLKAMDEQSKLKMELKKLEEGYQKQEKLIKSKENSDHLKKSEERLEKRSSDELKDLRSKICIECKSKNDRVIVLEGELKRLNQKIEEARVDSANLEVKATQARKNVKELREDILGLNIALEAKQQEIAYLKREKLARKAASDPRSLNLGDSKPIISKSTARKILQQSSSRYDFEKSSKVDDQFSLGVNIKTSDMSRKMLSQITNLQRDDSIEKLDVNRNQALNKSTKNTKALDKSTKKTQALDTSVRTKTTKAKLGASEYSILSENTIINNNDLKPTSTIATKERMNRMVPSFISVSSNEGSVSNNRRFSVVNHSSSSRS
ncbi:hypothetical protein BY996DRAFT_17417 [Phakopsora pachyrhizi]|nr:hypothetical protein BY996DRAFT_17417 [Phakopsora pachyrhizi]